jgi:hypothetical protein
MTLREFPQSTRTNEPASVEADALRAKLGRATFIVWQALCSVRSATGVTHVTDAGLTHVRGFERIPLSVVKDSLAKLRRVGLIEAVGWRKLPVASGLGSELRWTYLRRVHGEQRGSIVVVPQAVAAWAARAASWGGTRVGAGRPCKRPLLTRRPVRLRLLEVATEEEVVAVVNGAADAQDVCADSRFLANRKQSRPPLDLCTIDLVDSSLLRKEEYRVRDAVGSSARLESADGSGSKLPHLAALGIPHPDVPTVRSVAAVAPCSIPDPPLLDPSDSEERHAFLLSRWFLGAVESRFGKRSWAFGRGHITRSKHYAALVAIAKVFIERQVAPAAWCAFSCDVWKRIEPSKPPSVKWVFSATRIAERAEWFHSEENDYSGGTVVYTPSGRELLARLARLRTRIQREVTMHDEQKLRDVVAETLPQHLLDRLVADAKREATEMTADLRSQVASGDWVWL